MKFLQGLSVFLLLTVSLINAQSPDDATNWEHDYIDDEPIQGSGDGGILEPVEATTEVLIVPVVDLPNDTNQKADEQNGCPDVCTCSGELENGEEKFIVDCSNKGLAVLPTNIDTATTVLNIENNQIKELPKSLSELKALKVLNANNNLIMELRSGSISELAELQTLKLSNNRLIEFPQELKNGFSLTKLQEIDISGNDLRSDLTASNFVNFISLRKLILPSQDASTNIAESLCDAFHKTLETVCLATCDSVGIRDCVNAPEDIGEEFLKANLSDRVTLTSALPDVEPIKGILDNQLPYSEDSQDTNTDPSINNGEDVTENPSTVSELDNVEPNIDTNSRMRSFVDEATTTEEVSKDSAHKSEDIKVGATTSNGETGVIDKSVVGMVVAGMVLIVAGIILKKNWSSLRKRFSSTPRPASERNGTGNGVTPEEVPLNGKDKSPV